MTITTTSTSETLEALEARIFEAVLGTVDVFSIYIGDKLDLYRTLARNGPLSRNDLCARTGINRRYADEWLEQQVTTGFLTVDDPAAAPTDRRYSISAAHAEVLTSNDSLSYLAPFVRLIVAGTLKLPDLLDAYTSGGGVPWAAFGPDMRTGQADMNRPWFINQLGSTWFPAVDGLHERLTAGSEVADVGCGEGWSTIAMAQSYPRSRFTGFDIDAPSVHAARAHAVAAGVDDRVSFQLVDAAEVRSPGSFDVVTAFECIHDMGDPVGVLATIRESVKPDGWVVVMEEAVGDRFGDRTDEVERLMYGFSLFVCLPDGMSHEGSVGTGTVIRLATLERYAREAGFAGIEVLPIEHDLWRFYRLNQR